MIDTLIFDFGAIFMNLDKEATITQLKKLGLQTFTQKMIRVNEQYETGNITTEAFLDFYHKQFPNATKKQLSNAWNSIILDFPQHRLDFIKNLKNKSQYKLLLLSNTNELHINKVIENMGLEKYNQFKNSFDAFYLSHEIKLRKPDREIFDFVLNTHKLKPENCFFTDDTLEHIETAKSLGIKTWNLIPEKEDVTQLFNKFSF